jgi:hypothetical protein
MTTTDGLDRTLGSWFEREASADGAATILDAALERTARRSPRPAWVASLHAGGAGTHSLLGQPAVRRLGYVAVAALVIASLLAAALFVAGNHLPPPARPLGCVGSPPTLCGNGAGEWESTAFLPGLSVTFPVDGWYVRDLPDHLEFKIAPMSSIATVDLDPIPAAEPWISEPDRPATVPTLVDWLARNESVILGRIVTLETATKLRTTTFDLTMAPQAEGACRRVFGTRADPTGPHIIEACHYAQRLSLMDTGDGHVLAVIRIAYDSQPATLDRFDAEFAPILDSIRPPAPIGP